MDLESFSNLIQEHRKVLVGKAFKILGDWDTAEDVVQRTLDHLQTRIGSFRDDGPASPVTWVMTAVIRRSLNELRDQRRRIERMLDQSATSPTPYDILTSECIDREKDLVLELIHSWISDLERTTPLTASIMRGFYIEGKSWADVAKEVGISVGACRLRAMYTRRKWKKLLESYFLGREDVLKDIIHA